MLRAVRGGKTHAPLGREHRGGYGRTRGCQLLVGCTLDRMARDTHAVDEGWQSETAEWRDRLVTAAQASAGYAGAELRPKTRELVIYSVGGPTDSMAALIRDAPSSIRVTWREAPYTLVELTAEVRRLMAEQRARLSSAGPRHDGTGIQVTTTDTELLRAHDPQGLLSSHYPISVHSGEPPIAM